MRTKAIEDYCKAIWRLAETGRPVVPGDIAAGLGVTPASVTGMLRKLSDLHLVVWSPYKDVELTEAGRAIALETIRHHRLIELFLAEALGMPWDRVHEEAERLEHVISEELEDRMDAVLGHPRFDPHGDPIPSRSGELAERPLEALVDCAAGRRVQVARVSDHDPELLRYLGELGLYPGTTVEIVGVEPYQGPLRLDLDGRAVLLGRAAALHVQVIPALPPARKRPPVPRKAGRS